jgi:hypothetical protein
MMKLSLFLLVLGCLILLAACSNPTTGPIIVPGVVIETYNPTDPIYGAPTDTRISLYSDAAFNKDNPLAQADEPGSYDKIYISQGLDSGTYYIKVEGSPLAVGNTGPYAIRVLVNPTQQELSNYVPFAGTNDSDSPYDTPVKDDGVDANGKPTNPVTITTTQPLNRYISMPADTDVDWMILVLP